MNFDLFTPTRHSFRVFSDSITAFRLTEVFVRRGKEVLLEWERAKNLLFYSSILFLTKVKL